MEHVIEAVKTIDRLHLRISERRFIYDDVAEFYRTVESVRRWLTFLEEDVNSVMEQECPSVEGGN